MVELVKRGGTAATPIPVDATRRTDLAAAIRVRLMIAITSRCAGVNFLAPSQSDPDRRTGPAARHRRLDRRDMSCQPLPWTQYRRTHRE
jgi:hypothetical protein